MTSEIKRNREVSEKLQIPPSENLAWLIGVHCGTGRMDEYKILYQDRNAEVIKRYVDAVKEVFGVDAIVRRLDKPDKPGYSQRTTIKSKNIRNFFGDMSPEGWWDNINQNHPWVLGENYVTHLLAGYYDAKGNIYNGEGKGNSLIITCADPKGAAGLGDVLKSFGIEPRLVWDRQNSKLLRIQISNIHHISLFANLVTPTKESDRIKFQEYEGAQLVNLVPDDVLVAYNRVMFLRKETGFGAIELLKMDELKKYRELLNVQIIESWINSGRKPEKRLDAKKYVYKKDLIEQSEKLTQQFCEKTGYLPNGDLDLITNYFLTFQSDVFRNGRMERIIGYLDTLDSDLLQGVLSLDLNIFEALELQMIRYSLKKERRARASSDNK